MEMIIEFLLEILVYGSFDNLEEWIGKRKDYSISEKFLLSFLFSIGMILWLAIIVMSFTFIYKVIISEDFNLGNIIILLVLIITSVFISIRIFRNILYLKRVLLQQ